MGLFSGIGKFLSSGSGSGLMGALSMIPGPIGIASTAIGALGALSKGGGGGGNRGKIPTGTFSGPGLGGGGMKAIGGGLGGGRAMIPRVPSLAVGGGIGGGRSLMGRMGRVGGTLARGAGAVAGTLAPYAKYAAVDYVVDRMTGQTVAVPRRRKIRAKGVTGRDIKGARRVMKLVKDFGSKPKLAKLARKKR